MSICYANLCMKAYDGEVFNTYHIAQYKDRLEEMLCTGMSNLLSRGSILLKTKNGFSLSHCTYTGRK